MIIGAVGHGEGGGGGGGGGGGVGGGDGGGGEEVVGEGVGEGGVEGGVEGGGEGVGEGGLSLSCDATMIAPTPVTNLAIPNNPTTSRPPKIILKKTRQNAWWSGGRDDMGWKRSEL